MKYLIIFLFFLACSPSKDDLIENCADSKTASHWYDRQLMYQKNVDRSEKNILDAILNYKLGKISKEVHDASVSASEISRKINLERVNLYKNYKKKSLDHKLHMNFQFKDNFEKCENEFNKNPITFRNVYK